MGAIIKGPKDPFSSADWKAMEAEFLATGQAGALQKSLTVARDQATVEAYTGTMQQAYPRGVAMLAGGAFGRGQMFPYAELDVVVLLESSVHANAVKEMLPELVRRLWNQGLRTNAQVLTLAECIEAVEQGSASSYAVLDRRFLAGDRAVFHSLDEKFSAALVLHGDKMRQHLCQLAQARHLRFGNTPYHAEPDVKEAPGGTQDARLIHWLQLLKIAPNAGSEGLNQAVAFVSTVRAYLHFSAAGDHNVFDFEAQRNFASQAFAAGRSSADLVSEYFRSARLIFHDARHAMEGGEKQSSLFGNFREYRARLSNQEFTVSRERVFLRHPTELAASPAAVFRLLEFLARNGVPPAFETERRLELAREPFAAFCAQPQPYWNEVKAILSAPDAVLAFRTMQSTGLLAALIPEWTAIEHAVGAEFSYPYTAGEQTLRTLDAVHQLRSAARQPSANFEALLHEVEHVPVLLFALLFQEMGRGNVDAVECARGIASRMQMPAPVFALVEFLLTQQFALSAAVAGQRLGDPATVNDLAQKMGTSERLRLLVIATYARLAALPADHGEVDLEQLWRAYTEVQHELIRSLETNRIQQVPEAGPAEAGFVRGFPLRYLRAHSAAELTAHLRLYEQSRPTGVAASMERLDGGYRLTVIARDKPFLFTSFTGAISSFELNILKAEAFSNAFGTVLDSFLVDDPKGTLQKSSEVDRLVDLIQRVALGRTNVHSPVKGKPAADVRKRVSPPQVVFDSDACDAATLVEINAEDRPGLLYALASVFSSNACNIDVVLVDTKGHRAIDVFYVAHDGRKLSVEMQERLREKLLAAC